MNLFKRLGFLTAYTIPSLVVLGYILGGIWVLAAFVFAYICVPILDELIGKDPENIGSEALEEIADDFYFELIVRSMVYVQVGIVIGGCYLVSIGHFTWLEAIGMTLSVMTFTSSGINVAHELGHKKNPWARFHAKLNLMTVCYMHFYIEHNRGHHVNVATPIDPATSRKNQSFYAFWSQSVFGGWRSAWHLEKQRLERRDLSVWSLSHNEMLRFILLPLLFVGVLTLGFSLYLGAFAWQALVFFFAQSFLAFSSLEAVNYIEHYGIQRREIRPGRYERVNPLHSWNANHLVSNLMLFQLQRHSDHHAFASRPYQILRHFDESPQLPFGYPVMILSALVPPLWFKLMNPRLEEWKAKAYNAEQMQETVQKYA